MLCPFRKKVVSIRVVIAVMKHSDQSRLGRKVFIRLTYHNPLTEAKAGTQTGRAETWIQELLQGVISCCCLMASWLA